MTDMTEIVLNHTVHPKCLSLHIVSRAYTFIKGRNPKFGMSLHLGVAKCRVPFLGSLLP